MSEDPAALWEANAETWTQHARAGYDVYRDVHNTPAFLALLPPVSGLRGLDIGCGEGANTRAVAKLGARMDGVDIAPTFVAHAQAAESAEPLGISYRVGDAGTLPFADAAFDFTVAFMSFMDVPDHRRALAEAFRVTRPGGFITIAHFHHTLSEWFDATTGAGFMLEKISEPMADEATALAHPVVADTRITPLFLHLRARRPPAGG